MRIIAADPKHLRASIGLPPSRVQELQGFEENEHNNADTNRHRKIVQVRRPEAEKSRSVEQLTAPT